MLSSKLKEIYVDKNCSVNFNIVLFPCLFKELFNISFLTKPKWIHSNSDLKLCFDKNLQLFINKHITHQQNKQDLPDNLKYSKLNGLSALLHLLTSALYL